MAWLACLLCLALAWSGAPDLVWCTGFGLVHRIGLVRRSVAAAWSCRDPIAPIGLVHHKKRPGGIPTRDNSQDRQNRAPRAPWEPFLSYFGNKKNQGPRGDQWPGPKGGPVARAQGGPSGQGPRGAQWLGPREDQWPGTRARARGQGQGPTPPHPTHSPPTPSPSATGKETRKT